MKNQIRHVRLAILVAISFSFSSTFAQVSTGTNAIVAGQYVGSSTFVDVDNVAQQNQNINFYTNGGITYPWANLRMTILANGNVGVGNFTPTSPFHTQYSASGLTSGFSANLFENLATSGTAAINKYGLEIQSTGIWNGTNAVNVGLRVNAAGGFTNYSGLFTGGNFGIETTVPDLKLSVGDINDLNADGGILVVGSMNGLSTGTSIPNGLQMPRMFWYPLKAAFRSGYDNTGQWDDANIGKYSVAIGQQNTASGFCSVSLGASTQATGLGSFSIGGATNATANYSGALNGGVATGEGSLAVNGSIANGYESFAANQKCESNGTFSCATGTATIATGESSFSMGLFTEAHSYSELVLGAYNLACASCTPGSWQSLDPVFEIGNGSAITPANSVTVLKDGRTGIGLATYPPLTTVQLHVERKTDAVAGTTTATAGYFDAENTWNAGYAIGVQGYGRNAAGVGCSFVSGGRFFGFGGTNGATGTQGVFGYGIGAKTTNWGGYFEAAVSPTQNPQNTGVSGIASRAKFNVGVYGYAPSPLLGTVNYGVWGDIGRACPGFPAGPPCPTGPDYAGYFTGDVISLTNFFQLSDENYKDNVQDITNPMDVLSQLNPKTYTYKQQDNPSMNLAGGTHYGLLAQELENVLPDLVKNSIHPARYDSLGDEIFPQQEFKAVSYTELIPFLIAAIKEQQQNIEAMQAEIATLNGGGNRHANPGSGDENSGEEEKGNSSSIDVELSNAKSIVLNQNVPNPFAEQTVITYFIPESVSKAQVFFYDNIGTILRVVDIKEKGEGKINVFASDLSSGNYTYTLIADGNVVETRKMIKQ